VNAHEAVISSRSGRRIVFSSVPLVASSGTGAAAPVDLRLRGAAGGFVAVNPLTPVLIGSSLGRGVRVGPAGLWLRLQGADVAAERLGRSSVVFSDVARDTDAVVSPTVGGVEISVVLRSPLSPERLRLAVGLPRGARLVANAGGSVSIVRFGVTLGRVLAPVAVDAQGSAVPISMTASASSLLLSVSHRGRDFAYPILVDPQVAIGLSSSQGSWSEQGPLIWLNDGKYGTGDPLSITASGGRYYGSSSDWVQWGWTGPSVSTSGSVTVTDTFYDVTVADWDTTGTLVPEIDLTNCQNAALHAVLRAQPGQVFGYQQYSYPLGVPCNPVTPIVINQIENSSSIANGGALSQMGSFLITISYSCTSNCPVSGPSGSEGYGDANAGEPGITRASCGNWPVNCATGNQFEVQSDLSVPGRGLGLSLTRTYNSQAAVQGATGPFGAGWSSSLSDHLAVNQPAGVATVTQANGSTVPFTISGSSFVAPAWVHATLVKNGDGSYTYTLANQDSYHFDSNGRLLSEADRNGETTSAGYDAQGRLATITDPAGRTITLTYNSDGTVASAADSSGRSVFYSYSGGNLVGVTDAAGGVWSFGYDASHQLTSETDPRGHTVTTSYNASNQVSSQTDPAGRTRTWTYSPGETVIHNPDGTQTDEHFNGQLLTSITHAYQTSLAATTSFAYDRNGNVTAVTDPKGNVTSYSYDSKGNRTRATDPLDRITKWTYDSLNDVTSSTDPTGVKTTYSYDSHGNLLSVATPLVGTNQTQTITFTRGNSNHPGDVTAVTDPDGHTTSYGYDTAGDLTSVTDPLGNETTYGYDSIGRRTSMVSARGNSPGANPASFTTTYAYDPLSRLTSETDPLGHTQTWSYDGDGNVISYTDQNNNTTTYSYDADNELTTTTRPDTTTLQNSYDANGNLTSQTDGAGHTTNYGYDALERVTSTTDPLSRKTTYAYDAAGNLTGVTDPQGRTTSYGYDAANQLTSISYSDGSTPNVTYGYDLDGRRTSMSDGTGASSYVYDSLGRMTSSTDGHGDHTAFGYDLAGNQTSITYPNTKTVTRSFDNAENLSSITDWLGNTTSFAYDPDTNLQTTTFPAATGNVDTSTYDNADQLTGTTFAQAGNTLASLNYQRDGDGQITQASSSGLNDPTHSYSYNTLNQLTADNTNSYSYDNADNPTTLAGASGYSYDAANQLTDSPTASYSYNSLGQRTTTTPTSGTATNYGYDQAGRLTSVTGPSNATYTYNGDGLRATKTTGGSTNYFGWDPTSSPPLLLSDGTNNYIYGPDNLPIEQIDSSGNATYYHHDQLGSTRLLTNSNGNTAATFNYDAYGNVTTSTGSATTPLGYAGQYTDTETGLQYDQARYYDPQTGQFISRDPLEAQTRQPYSYAADNPVSWSDPTGDISGKKCLATALACLALGHSIADQPGSGQKDEAQSPVVTQPEGRGDPRSGQGSPGEGGEGGNGGEGGDGGDGENGGGDNGGSSGGQSNSTEPGNFLPCALSSGNVLSPVPPWMEPEPTPPVAPPPIIHPGPPIIQPGPPIIQPGPPIIQPGPPIIQPGPPILQPPPVVLP
jgi:RHS repeat-associated protein